MRSAIVTVTFAIAVLSYTPCLAAFTDFSDYALYTEFAIGQEFQSNGVSFKAVELLQTLTTTLVGSDSLFPDPLFSILAVGPGVEFLLPPNTQEISFFYESGGGRAITINGVEPPSPRDASLSFLDGTSVAGVDITTVLDYQSGEPGSFFGVVGEAGIITLRGPITSFAIAGVELTIDDVSVIVPEPSTAMLLLAASLSLLATRRRRFAS